MMLPLMPLETKGTRRVDSLTDMLIHPAQVAGSREVRAVPFDGKPTCAGLRSGGLS